MSNPTKIDIRSLTKEALQNFFSERSISPFRGNQVYQWLWNKGVHDFDKMTNISLIHRTLLKTYFVINNIKIDRQQQSSDGTIKNAVELHDGLVVESVLIPSLRRLTACVSSQVGCSLDCVFCATSSMKRMRNLNVDEIYDQVVAMDKQSRFYYNRPLSNIVFMGMGEPLMNYNNVLGAIEKITHREGLGMASRRITLSTSGLPKLIKKMADQRVKFRLAVSLHSARQEVREKIMPFAKKFTLEMLKESLIYWYTQTRQRVTFEYVIWKGINDKIEDIVTLVRFCKSIPCKVNIIEYNPIEGSNFEQASLKVVASHIEALENARISTTFRQSRGRDVDAACGQLANKKF